MHTWPLAILFTPEQNITEGTIRIGHDNGWHHGWLAGSKEEDVYPSGLMPIYKGRLAEYSGAFGEQLFGKRLIIDLADIIWSELDLRIMGIKNIISGDDVFKANADRIREAVKKEKNIDQDVQIYGNELYLKMLERLKEEASE